MDRELKWEAKGIALALTVAGLWYSAQVGDIWPFVLALGVMGLMAWNPYKANR